MAVVAIRPHLVIGPGDTQLVGRIIDRASQGRLPLIGSGLALVDTTWVDNAAEALLAALDRAPQLGGRAFVVSNGEPRTVHELFARIMKASGTEWTPRSVPASVAIAGGTVVEKVWNRTSREDDPPMTAFGAEQLSTAHWFDQRDTRAALGWTPSVSLAEGFNRLAAHYNP
jgi:nucleoside-diphosphate-sugar epimerase